MAALSATLNSRCLHKITTAMLRIPYFSEEVTTLGLNEGFVQIPGTSGKRGERQYVMEGHGATRKRMKQAYNPITISWNLEYLEELNSPTNR